MRRDPLRDRLAVLEERIGAEVAEIDETARKQLQKVIDIEATRRRLDGEELEEFETVRERVNIEGLADETGEWTADGRRYLSYVLDAEPDT